MRMSEANITVPSDKRSIKNLLVKGLTMLLAVGCLFAAILLSADLLVGQHVSEGIYTFLFSHLFIVISGILYGGVLILYRAPTLDDLKVELKKCTKPLLVTTGLAYIFIIGGYALFFVPGLVLLLFFFFYPFVV